MNAAAATQVSSSTDEELMVLWTELLAPSTVAEQRRRWNALVARLDPIVRMAAMSVLRRYGVATANFDRIGSVGDSSRNTGV